MLFNVLQIFENKIGTMKKIISFVLNLKIVTFVRTVQAFICLIKNCIDLESLFS